MKLGIDKARETMNKNYGGPFGAVIVKNNEVVAIASNTVLKDNDPTAHAEINAIREACKKLNTYDLSNCTLYATGYPCPMCLSAIIWANIKEVYYGTELKDAETLGFRDDHIYNFIRNNNIGKILNLSRLDREECLKLFEEYKNNNKKIY
jgi:guanine deaminase